MVRKKIGDCPIGFDLRRDKSPTSTGPEASPILHDNRIISVVETKLIIA